MLVRVYAIIIAICVVIGWTFKVEASGATKAVVIVTLASQGKPIEPRCRMNNEGIKGGITCERGWLVNGRREGAK